MGSEGTDLAKVWQDDKALQEGFEELTIPLAFFRAALTTKEAKESLRLMRLSHYFFFGRLDENSNSEPVPDITKPSALLEDFETAVKSMPAKWQDYKRALADVRSGKFDWAPFDAIAKKHNLDSGKHLFRLGDGLSLWVNLVIVIDAENYLGIKTDTHYTVPGPLKWAAMGLLNSATHGAVFNTEVELSKERFDRREQFVAQAGNCLTSV